ncbi:MAG: hypothetical protein WC943_15675, partial [Elusimicrobiota bacterium]
MKTGPSIACDPSVYKSLQEMPPKRTEGLIRAIESEARKRRFHYKGRHAHPMGLAPMSAGKGLASSIMALTRVLHRFQMRAPELHRADYRGFGRLIRLETGTQRWFSATAGMVPKPWPLLMRPDFTLGLRNGALSPTLLELNSLMLGGLYIQSVARSLMAEQVLPAIETSPARLGLTPTADLISYFARWLGACRARHGRGPGGVALLESLPPGGGFSELPRITEGLRKAGERVEHGDPKELELRGNRVFLHGMAVAYAFRDFSFEDTSGPSSPSMAAFAALWRAGRVAPGFPADFDQKGILECLTSEEFSPLFTRAESRLLSRHVPWTRVLSKRKTDSAEGRLVDLPSHVLA